VDGCLHRISVQSISDQCLSRMEEKKDIHCLFLDRVGMEYSTVKLGYIQQPGTGQICSLQPKLTGW